MDMSMDPRDTSTSTSSDTMQQAKQQAGQLADQAQQKAGQAADAAQQQAMSQASSQKARVAQGVSDVAQAMDQVGQQLRQNDKGQVAHYTDMTADQLRQLSSYINQQEIGQMIGDVESFIRRRPALALGGAFALGLLGARFLKSSSQTGTGGQMTTPSGRYGGTQFHSSSPYRRYNTYDPYAPSYNNTLVGEAPASGAEWPAGEGREVPVTSSETSTGSRTDIGRSTSTHASTSADQSDQG